MTPAASRWPPGPGWIDFAVAHRQDLRLRRVVARRDAALLQQWFCSERGRFWTMPDKSLAGLQAHYAHMQRSEHACAFLGHVLELAAFVVECYDPAHDGVAAHYQVEPGDVGLHLFVGPPQTIVPHFTRDVFRFVLTFMFRCLGAKRIVVEPDVDNLRIHALNRSMGFREAGRIALGDKMATLAFCTPDDFMTCQPTDLRP